MDSISSRINVPQESRIRIQRAESGADAPDTAAVVDPAEAAVRALASPLNFPSLAEATVPGDHLAIALDDSLPCAPGIVSGVVRAAVAAGIAPEAITVVSDDVDLSNSLRSEFSHGANDAVQVVIHDPDDARNLCLVGQLEEDKRLRINRAIYEADVVLPISCARLISLGGGGVYGSLFPRFCDAETIGRLRTPSQRESPVRRAAARRRADEAGWLVGAALVMQVVPGGAGTIAEVVAGEPAAVDEHCQQACRRLWSFRVPRRASLVIASVTGDRQEQTWENIGRALAAAAPLVDEGGAVAVCSDLELPPSSALGRLLGNADWETAERDARKDRSADSWPAWQLARALQRGPVYFLSRLDDETVEDMGLAPVADMDELARLAGRHQSCIVLDDSQHAAAIVADES